MNYYRVCYTNVSRWYANKFNKMIESQDITTDYTPDYKLEKQKISGGHHTIPKKILIKEFIAKCKEELGIIVEIKNKFENSMFYGKKNSL